jgi:hypothetical protein
MLQQLINVISLHAELAEVGGPIRTLLAMLAIRGSGGTCGANT